MNYILLMGEMLRRSGSELRWRIQVDCLRLSVQPRYLIMLHTVPLIQYLSRGSRQVHPAR